MTIICIGRAAQGRIPITVRQLSSRIVSSRFLSSLGVLNVTLRDVRAPGRLTTSYLTLINHVQVPFWIPFSSTMITWTVSSQWFSLLCQRLP
jgi:hypothetical protein